MKFKPSHVIAILALATFAMPAMAKEKKATGAPAAAMPAAAAPAAAMPAAMTPDAKAALSKKCSADADAKQLHGKDRKKFREACKKGKSA